MATARVAPVSSTSSSLGGPRGPTSANAHATASAAGPAVVIDSGSDLTKVTTKRLLGHRSQVRQVAWNADGRRLASGSKDMTLRIWQPEKDPRSSVEYRGHTGEVSLVRWNPMHPERLASCSATASDKSLHFWDMRQGGRPTHTIETAGDSITMTWSPDGETIVIGNRRDVVQWIDVGEQKMIKKGDMGRETNEAVFSHNGSLLFTAIDGTCSITTVPAGDEIHRIQMSPAATTVLDLDPKGRYLAAGSNDATVTLWETREWTCVSSMGAHEDPVRACRFSQDGQYVASTCGDREIVISQVPTLKKAITLPTNGLVDTLAWHPTRNLLAYACEDLEGGRPSGAVRIWGL